jgi:lipid-binding SYLF domain-containing protein
MRVSVRIGTAAIAGLLVAGTAQAVSMQSEIDQAAAVIEDFKAMPEKGIPRDVLASAKGLAIVSLLKAGFIVTGQGGGGVVVARLGGGWSGPSAVGIGGVGVGFQVGAQVTDYVLVLNTPDAVDAFARGGNVALGAELSVAAGPVGRAASADVLPVAAVYSYSRSQGLFAGVSLEGMVIVTRDELNREYYGHPVTPREILSGKVKAPAGSRRLTEALKRY